MSHQEQCLRLERLISGLTFLSLSASLQVKDENVPGAKSSNVSV